MVSRRFIKILGYYSSKNARRKIDEYKKVAR